MLIRKAIVGVAALVIAVLAAGCAGARTEAPPEAKSLTFMAAYKPQANLPFVGVYVAQEKGFFEEVGLEVTIQHSAGGGQELQLLTSGEVDVTTQDAAVLLQRRADPGLPLLSIALVGQRGQQGFAALADSGLESPKDWEGHTVGFKGTPPPDLFALLDAAGANREAIQLVNVGFDPRVLVEGQVDVYPVFKSNEPYLINKLGHEIRLWDAAEYGVPTLGLVYATTPEIAQKDPERMRRFVQAAIRGVAYAEEHPDEAVEIVLKYTGPEAEAAHMRFMLDTELKDAHSPVTDEHGLGWQTAEQWQALADTLLEYDSMAGTVDVSEVFTNEFLEGASE